MSCRYAVLYWLWIVRRSLGRERGLIWPCMVVELLPGLVKRVFVCHR